MPGTIQLSQREPLAGRVAETMPVFGMREMQGTRREGVETRIRNACHEHGFLCIELDDRTHSAVETTLSTMRRFFAIDDGDPVKQRIRRQPDQTGWVPQYTEPAYQPGTVSSLEAFDCDLADVEGTAPYDIWPQVGGFRASVTGCWRAYEKVAVAVLGAIARAARVPPDVFASSCSSRELNTLRLLHYAETPPRDRDRNVGIAAHTDFECITLLYQTAPGLELLGPDGRWLDAPPTDGRILVLLGDMLERWTNGYFRATGHRVRETAEQRFSIVMFVAVDDGVQVAPLSKFVSATTPALFAPVTQSQHIANEMSRSRQNMADGF